jgi:hypothetical protein
MGGGLGHWLAFTAPAFGRLFMLEGDGGKSRNYSDFILNFSVLSVHFEDRSSLGAEDKPIREENSSFME